MTRIGLISPYNGTNLGDQAIYSTCIELLRAKLQDAELVGICLNPAAVSAIHRIPTFPVTGLEVPFYSNARGLFSAAVSSTKAAAPVTQAQHEVIEAAEPRSLRNLLKKVPGARAAVEMLRRLRDRFSNVPREIGWIVRSWRLVGELDVLVVTGGGQFDEEWGGSWGHPYALFRWASLARLRGKPFVIASVGYCRVDRRLSRFFVRSAVASAAYVSCRDEGSVEAVRALAGRRDVLFVPDIACGLEPSTSRAPAAPEPARIAVSPIAFGRSGAWPFEAEQIYQSYIAALAEFTAGLLVQGRSVRVFTTSSPDGPAVRDLVEHVRARAPDHMSNLDVIIPRTAEELFACLAPCPSIVASRLHGVMLSHLINKPVVAISFDRKVDVHLQQFGQSRFGLDIRHVSREQIEERFAELEERAPAIKEELRARATSCSGLVHGQFDRILAIATRQERAGADMSSAKAL